MEEAASKLCGEYDKQEEDSIESCITCLTIGMGVDNQSDVDIVHVMIAGEIESARNFNMRQIRQFC